MIEITTGTLEEHVIKILQKHYPITVKELQQKLHIQYNILMRTLQKLQIKNIIHLQPLPDKIYIRLLRNDFRFVGRKHQKKFIKHRTGKKPTPIQDYNGIMYT